jgi:hypothetical protein|tara:strand:- start:3079 stop:3432 length:354 start_codon:yes stop_codon:yes gene_type:complete
MSFKTPDSIVGELVDIRSEAAKGVDALYNAEIKLAHASLDADLAESRALLSSEGNVAERQAFAKVEAAEARLNEDIARAEYNRVRTKMKILEQSQMSVQTQARMIEMMYKTAGTGER